MKKIVLISLLCAALFSRLGAQLSSTCSYSTCIPKIGFDNSDLVQIYGALISSRQSSSVSVVSGSVVVTNTVATTVTGTVPVSGSVSVLSTVAVSGSVSVVNTVTVTGNIGGYTAKPQSTLSADGAYVAGDNVGGIRSFTAFRTGQFSGVLLDVTVWDLANQKATWTIDFYSASPSGTFTDNQAQVMSDPTKYLGSITVFASDYTTTGSIARASVTNINLPLTVASGQTIYYTVVNASTPSYNAPQALYLSFGILQD